MVTKIKQTIIMLVLISTIVTSVSAFSLSIAETDPVFYDMLQEESCETYITEQYDYTVCLIYVTDPLFSRNSEESFQPEAVFSINGEWLRPLLEGEMAMTECGSRIEVGEMLTGHSPLYRGASTFWFWPKNGC